MLLHRKNGRLTFLCSAIYFDYRCGSRCAVVAIKPAHQGARAASGLQGETSMVKNFEDMQKLGKDNMDATLTSLGALSKGFQTIAVEMADYTRKAFEDSTAATEKLFGA